MVCDLVAKYESDIVRHISRLIQFPSKRGTPEPGMPFGRGAGEALNYILAVAKELGFSTVNLDGYCGYAQYGEGSETVCVVSHLDVVPEGSGWSVPPYGGVIADGKIYGRGASDNKASAVVSLYGLKAIADSGLVPDRKIRVLFGTNEESGMADMKYYVEREGLPRFAFTPDGGYRIVNGEKGRMVARFYEDPAGASAARKDGAAICSIQGGDAPNRVPESCEARMDFLGRPLSAAVAGVPAHGAAPENGVNAIAHMLHFLRDYFDPAQGLLAFLHNRLSFETDGGRLGIKSSDESFGPLTVNLGLLHCSADEAFADADIRYPLSISSDAILSSLEKEARAFGVRVDMVQDMEPFYIDKSDKLIALLARAYHEMTGGSIPICTGAGGTYSKILKNRCVLFGGVGAKGHEADEYVEISEVMRHARICTHAMVTLSAD